MCRDYVEHSSPIEPASTRDLLSAVHLGQTKSLEKSYMMRNKKGFTLIELLIVVVIIGLLAAIAIPKFANTKDKAHIASMKTDLRNLATVEEAFFYDSATYTTSFALMNNYTPSVGVTVVINEATSKGWAATATSIN